VPRSPPARAHCVTWNVRLSGRTATKVELTSELWPYRGLTGISHLTVTRTFANMGAPVAKHHATRMISDCAGVRDRPLRVQGEGIDRAAEVAPALLPRSALHAGELAGTVAHVSIAGAYCVTGR